MENIKITAGVRSPEIDFNLTENTFLIKGESYPEDVNDFYGPIMENLKDHFDALDGGKAMFVFELIYFNSSTAKILMNLFDLLDEAAEAGCDISIEWRHEEDDDNMEEFGEEFGEDIEHASFELKAIPAGN
jgi:SiaC family regulatory phosphoprotein